MRYALTVFQITERTKARAPARPHDQSKPLRAIARLYLGRTGNALARIPVPAETAGRIVNFDLNPAGQHETLPDDRIRR